MEYVFLGIGSNIGDRSKNIDEATERLSDSFGTKPLAVSSYIETKSWGFDAPDFLNAVAVFEIEVGDPLEILRVCKDIEAGMGRKDDLEYDNTGKRVYHSRIIDIDILKIGERVVDLPSLKVPHPLMRERDFVQIPLKEIYNLLNIN